VTFGCHKPIPQKHLLYKERLERRIQKLKNTKCNREGTMDADYERAIQQANRFNCNRNYIRENALASSADRNLRDGSMRGLGGNTGHGNLPSIGDKASCCPSPKTMANRMRINKDQLLQGYMGSGGKLNLKKGTGLGALASILLKAGRDGNQSQNSTVLLSK
jgi:hypothetical protein